MKRYLTPFLLGIALLLIFLSSIAVSRFTGEKLHENRRELLENTIRSYAVQCYALEGAYPETLQYLEEHYTLALDREHYVYHYKSIGSNMVPEIYVFEKE